MPEPPAPPSFLNPDARCPACGGALHWYRYRERRRLSSGVFSGLGPQHWRWTCPVCHTAGVDGMVDGT